MLAATFDDSTLSDELFAVACSLLSSEELSDIAELKSYTLRRRSTAFKAVARILLAHFASLSPEKVEFDRAPSGKPYHAREGSLHFNLSHSASLLVLAITVDSEIGVDVEQVRAMPRGLQLARYHFLPEEAAALERVPDEERDLAFFHCWTQKEAYLKATGCGIDGALKAFRVETDMRRAAGIHWIAGDDPACWQMHRWYPSPGYVAAVAYRDRRKELKCSGLLDAAVLLQAFREGCLAPALEKVP